MAIVYRRPRSLPRPYRLHINSTWSSDFADSSQVHRQEKRPLHSRDNSLGKPAAAFVAREPYGVHCTLRSSDTMVQHRAPIDHSTLSPASCCVELHLQPSLPIPVIRDSAWSMYSYCSASCSAVYSMIHKRNGLLAQPDGPHPPIPQPPYSTLSQRYVLSGRGAHYAFAARSCSIFS